MSAVVLFVDDDYNLLRSLARALRQQPYKLLTTNRGEEAMFILKGHHVDVVVSDENMPGMRGTALLAWVATEFPGIARFLLTGNPTVDVTIKAANECGLTRLFTKPCDVEQLAAAIREAVEQRASASLACARTIAKGG